MNKQLAANLGKVHAQAGKKLTPFDCREVDAELLAAAKSAAEGIEDYVARVTTQAKAYRQLRGAFNKAWEAAYFASFA